MDLLESDDVTRVDRTSALADNVGVCSSIEIEVVQAVGLISAIPPLKAIGIVLNHARNTEIVLKRLVIDATHATTDPKYQTT